MKTGSETVVDEFLGMEEAIRLLKTTPPTFYRWLRQGRLKGIKAGRQWRFRREDIDRFLRGEGPQVDVSPEIFQLIASLKKHLAGTGRKSPAEDGGDPLLAAVDLMIRLGLSLNASDIHLEAFQDRGVLRYRVDGVLHEKAAFSPRLTRPLVDQWKTRAKCNVQVSDLPQDSKFVWGEGSGKVTVFVGVLPTVAGESIVARLAGHGGGELSLEKLPLQPVHREIFLRHLAAPHGVILCCGPTGSGKTTLMYAALNHLNTPDRKLVSAEDPVEYHWPGVNQVQVNPARGLTFAGAIRSFLRSDPDVMMVGEIRDPETAHLCCTAALTGHLVLTQLHSSSAVGALVRLTDMGIPPFLVGDALRLVIAQRLVRKTCARCARRRKPTATERERALRLAVEGGIPPRTLPDQWVEAVGCKECKQLGYRGRACVNEFLEMTEEIRSALIRKAPKEELMRLALRQGMTTLAAEAVRRAADGETTLEEAFSVGSS